MIKIGDLVIIRDAMDSSLIGKIGRVEEVSQHAPYSCTLEIDGESGSWANAFPFSCLDIFEAKPKPPLGIMPKYIWDAERMRIIRDAIYRYSKAGVRIPEEWVKEYNELIGLYTRQFTIQKSEGV